DRPSSSDGTSKRRGRSRAGRTGLWGAKISVLPANRGFPAMRTEFWHPTGIPLDRQVLSCEARGGLGSARARGPSASPKARRRRGLGEGPPHTPHHQQAGVRFTSDRAFRSEVGRVAPASSVVIAPRER